MKIFLVAIFFFSLDAHPYELACRGPLAYRVGGSPLPSNALGWSKSIRIFFQKGTSAAGLGYLNLSPGTCTFIDRGLADNEASELLILTFFNWNTTLSDRDLMSQLSHHSDKINALIPALTSSKGYFKVDVLDTSNQYQFNSSPDRISLVWFREQ